MPRPAVIEALNDLDPGQRALLDLSLNRRLSDALIASLLENVDESGVAEMRARALAEVATAARLSGPGAAEEVQRVLRTASDNNWLGNGNGNGSTHRNGHANGNGIAPIGAASPAGTTRPVRSRPRPESRRRSGTWVAVLVLLALVGAAALVVALVGGDDGGSETPAAAVEPAPNDAPDPPPPPPPAPAPDVAAEAVAFEKLPGAPADASVSVRLVTDGLYELRLGGLPAPDGVYALWLYDSLIDSDPLGEVDPGASTLRFRLPGEAQDFAGLDLSVEEGPGDTLHSGRSQFRLPLTSLPG